MAQSFDITSAVATVTASPTTGMRGEVPFTVRNVTGRRLRVGARIRAAAPAQEAWFRIAGETERDLAVSEVAQYVVQVQVPAATAEGTARFHLQIFAVDEPSEVYTDGPTVTLAIGASAVPPPPPRRRFPWWIPVAAVVVLAVGGVSAWLLLRGPRMVQSPDVTGKTYAVAEEELGKKKLAASRREEGAKSPKEVGMVLRQEPPAGQALAPGEEVVLVVGVDPTVPNVVGMNSATAEKTLKDRGFTTKRINQLWRPAKADDVIGQTPAGDQKVAPQSEVTYVVALPKPCAATRHRHVEGNAAWVQFNLPAGQDGESKSWSKGTHWQYDSGSCRNISWNDIQFTCRDGTWVARSENYSSAILHQISLCQGQSSGHDQPRMEVGVLFDPNNFKNPGTIQF